MWEQTAQFRQVSQQLQTVLSYMVTVVWGLFMVAYHKCMGYSEGRIQNFRVCAVNHIEKLKFSTLSSVTRSEN